MASRSRQSAKVCLRGSGLLHHLLNLGTLDEVRNYPVHGASWETFVLEDIIRREKVRHSHAQFIFWRTADGAEIDLVIERGARRQNPRRPCGGTLDGRRGRDDRLDSRPSRRRRRHGLARRSFTADPEWLP